MLSISIFDIHGLGDSYHFPVYQQIIQQLIKYGYSVYAFDYPANVSPFDLPSQVKTIQEIIDSFPDYSRKTLLGGSFGALAATIISSANSNISELITVNGFFVYSDLAFKLAIRYRLSKFLPKYSKIFLSPL